MGRGRRATRIVYCVIPGGHVELLDALRGRFAEDPDVEVIVEMRHSERRRTANRREAFLPVERERREDMSIGDRRIAERRLPVRTLRRFTGIQEADEGPEAVYFVERLEPDAAYEDLDTVCLIRRVNAGERDLFGEIYARYFDRLYAYLRQLLRDPGEAEDAAQQTFLQALEALPRFTRRARRFGRGCSRSPATRRGTAWRGDRDSSCSIRAT